MHLAAGAAFVALPLALWLRLSDPVRRYLSRTDDYLSWAVRHGGDVRPVGRSAGAACDLPRSPAWHLITLELLLLWFPLAS